MPAGTPIKKTPKYAPQPPPPTQEFVPTIPGMSLAPPLQTMPGVPVAVPLQTMTMQQPPPQQQFIPVAPQQVYSDVKNNTDLIMTNEKLTPLYDSKNNVWMFRKQMSDMLLDKVNSNSFDHINFIINEVNNARTYEKKEKALMLQLARPEYSHLREYETIIRKATNLYVEADTNSLAKIQERICVDPLLKLLFQAVEQSRDGTSRKLTPKEWMFYKKYTMSYYVNYFLHRKRLNYMIKRNKIVSFAINCLLFDEINKSFKGFFIHEFDKVGVKDEDMFLPDHILVQQSVFEVEGSFTTEKYSSIFELFREGEQKWDEDPDNDEIKKAITDHLKQSGSSLPSSGSTLINYTMSFANWCYNNPTKATVGLTAAAATAAYFLVPWASVPSTLYSLLPGLPNLGISAGIASGLSSVSSSLGYVGSGIYNYGAGLLDKTANIAGEAMAGAMGFDGAIVSQKNAKAVPKDATKVSIGKIKKVNDKIVQSGYFYTLCIFVDDALDKCLNAYQKEKGPVPWGQEKDNDAPFDFQDFLGCRMKKKELEELWGFLSVADGVAIADITKIKDAICDFPHQGYKIIRDEIDFQLCNQIDKWIDVTSNTGAPKPTDALKVKSDKEIKELEKKCQIWFEKLNTKPTSTNATTIQFMDDYKIALAKPWDTTKIKPPRGAATFFDGSLPTPKALPDGGSNMMVTPRNKKSSNYKRSADYKRLKDDYKNGELTRDKFKQEKNKLKKRSRETIKNKY